MSEDDLCRELMTTENRVGRAVSRNAGPVTNYARLVRRETWHQAWDADARAVGPLRPVTGEVWSDAIERCLAEHGSVFIPEMTEPVYLDRPIVLPGKSRLIVHPQTEVRLIAGSAGTCMVRNENPVGSQGGPVVLCADPDTDIVIEGGIWSDQLNEGRGRGGACDPDHSRPGSHGIFLLHNVRGVAVRNIRFRDCSPFAIQIGNAVDFLIERIRFDETADGVHVEGPSARGIIRQLSGKTNDDVVALNAWDWENSSLTYGPISDMLVEEVEMRPGYTWSELRLLPGTKRFPDGNTVDCDIRRCVFRRLRGLHTVKLYDQPNVNQPDRDFADPIGTLSDLYFSDMVADGISRADYYDKSSDAVFDVCANVDGLSLRDIRLNYIPGESGRAPYLVSVGPKSLTWPKGPRPEDGWKEVFNPNANPALKGLRIRGVWVPGRDGSAPHVPCDNVLDLLFERHASRNPDFPNTMPRGGSGRGRMINPEIS